MNNLYNFYHSEWSDICILNEKENSIRKSNQLDELGKYYYKNNELIINWDKWIGDDIFINIYNGFYQKKYVDNYIKNFTLLEIILYDDNDEKFFFLNFEKKILFEKINLKNMGSFKLIDKFLYINWNNINDRYIRFNDKYYSEKYIKLLLDNINIIENNEKNILNETSNNIIENNETNILNKTSNNIIENNETNILNEISDNITENNEINISNKISDNINNDYIIIKKK
jgi:hypothetical protein